MIAAARKLFIASGYEAVTLGDVVRESGGSLSTLYQLFENKLGLLAAVIEVGSAEWLAEIGDLTMIDDPAAGLRVIAAELAQRLSDPDEIGMMRIAMAESLRNAEFGQKTYARAHLAAVDRLAVLFAAWSERRLLAVSDPVAAAEVFLGMIIHHGLFSALFGAPAARDGELREIVTAEAIRLMLSGYRCPQGDAPPPPLEG